MESQPSRSNQTGFDNLTDCPNITAAMCQLGPARDPLSTVLPMTLVYSVVLTTGVTGNVCTCIVIYCNRYMHTATNYYLFSLAVSDLLLLVLGLPQELYQLWFKYPYAFGEAFCILRGLTSEMSTNASILTITAFTVERYLAICHPLRAHAMSRLTRVVWCILIVWGTSAAAALPTAIQFGIRYETDGAGLLLPDTAQCSVVNPLPHTFEVSTGLFFVLPILVISILYVLIGIRLRRAALSGNEDDGMSGQQMRARKAVVKMLVAVVISFFVCWTPFHAQRLLAIYTTEVTPVLLLAFTVLTHISGVTYYLSATLNPILYQLLSVNFRQAFKDTFACRRRGKGGGKTVETSRYRVCNRQAKDATASWMSDVNHHHGLS